MTLTIGQIHNMAPVLRGLLTKRMPAKQGFRLAEFIKECDKHIEVYELWLNSAIEKYAETDEEGNPKLNEERTAILIKPEYQEVMEKENLDCINLEVEIKSKPIDVSTLDFFVTVSDLLALEPILYDGEAEEQPE